MSRALTDVTSDMSPEVATAKLAEMRAAKQRETPAADKLAGMLKNAAFLQTIDRGGAHGGSDGIALPGGGTFDAIQEAVAAFHAERGPVDLAMSGHLDDVNDGSYLQMKKTVDALRADGIGDDAIRQYISGKPVSRAEYDRAAQWKRNALEDPVFTASFLKGDPAAVRQMEHALIILTGPIKDDAA